MPEKQNIEWKSKWKDEYLEWICGYANAQGGKIYIGVDNNGNVIGLDNYQKLLEDIPNKIRNAMSIVVDVNLLEKDGKEYIEIVVPPYPVAISCKGIYHYRSGSTKQVLSGPELESFILRKRGATWDNMPLPSFTIDDIDDNLVKHFKTLAAKKGRIDASVLDEPKDVLMEKLHLTNAGYYTNAAMLLFGKDLDKWQLGAYTKIGFFENDADLLYQDEIHGSLLEQVDKIIEVIHLKYMKAKITYEGMQRIERYFVPEAALREAILNSLCHKQYESCIPIQISVYEDKLYIANCGRLPENWTVENLMSKHASRPYNPSIASVYYLAGYIENWGRGIEKICHACEEDGVFPPEYTIHPGDIMVKFSAPEGRLVRFLSSNGTVNGTQNGTVNETRNLSKNEVRLLEYLRKYPSATIMQMSNDLVLGRSTINRVIKSLKEKSFVVREGSDKSGKWNVLQ